MPKKNPYAYLELREQLYLEARAMAEYALAGGKQVPAKGIKTIEMFSRTPAEESDKEGGQVNEQKEVRGDLDIDELVRTHDVLTKIVEPAKPQTILLLDSEQKSTSFLRFLGPIPLIRHLMVAALTSLLVFIVIGLSPDVNNQAKSVLQSSGTKLLMNMLFYLSAAGLGASFAALYTANSYITKGTFDPTYQASYWIRFFLGLISGLLLAVMISDDVFREVLHAGVPGANGQSSKLQSGGLIEEGFLRVLLALLGGFSADLAYTILNRLVETVESLFRGSAKVQIAARETAFKSAMAKQLMEWQMKLNTSLSDLQSEVNEKTTPEEIRAKIADIKEKIGNKTNIIQ